MTQSLCARCLEALSPKQRHLGTILCDACEAAWRKDFGCHWQHDQTDRRNQPNRRATLPSGSTDLPHPTSD